MHISPYAIFSNIKHFEDFDFISVHPWLRILSKLRGGAGQHPLPLCRGVVQMRWCLSIFDCQNQLHIAGNSPLSFAFFRYLRDLPHNKNRFNFYMLPETKVATSLTREQMSATKIWREEKYFHRNRKDCCPTLKYLFDEEKIRLGKPWWWKVGLL